MSEAAGTAATGHWRDIVLRQDTQDNATLSYDALFLRQALWAFVAGQQPATPLLDIGANTGYACAWLGLAPGDYAGIEPSAALLAAAAAPVRARLARGVGEQLPFPDRHFNFLLMIEMLDHSHTPAAVLREARRVLAPGGTAVLSVANRGTLVRRSYCWYLRRRGLLPPGEDPHFRQHTFHFTRQEVRALAQAAGWRVAGERGYGYLPLPRRLDRFIPAALLRGLWRAANICGEMLLPGYCDGFIMRLEPVNR